MFARHLSHVARCRELVFSGLRLGRGISCKAKAKRGIVTTLMSLLTKTAVSMIWTIGIVVGVHSYTNGFAMFG